MILLWHQLTGLCTDQSYTTSSYDSQICTQGNLVIPKIIRNQESNEKFSRTSFLANESYLYIMKGMFNTVNNINGTAYQSRDIKPGYLMAGKTATSQVRRITMSEREEGIKKNEDLPRSMRDHALFVGYFQINQDLLQYSC